MPSPKSSKAASRRTVPHPPLPVPAALKAARRALDQQTSRVNELEAQVRDLTLRQKPLPEPSARVALTDTVIYWRRRLFR